MQWLIDILAAKVIAEIGIPPCYIDRGSYAEEDFALGDLTADGNWYELDLSAIVPAGTTAVVIRIKAHNTFAARFIRFRPHSTTSNLYTCEFRTQVAGLRNNANPVIGVDADRKIDYMFQGADWLSFDLVVRGWWL